MKKLYESKWFIEVDRLQGVIKVKADDGAKTPICQIATPLGIEWMLNEHWFENAMKKAEIVSDTPNLIEALKHLVIGIDNLLGENPEFEWQQAGYLEYSRLLLSKFDI